MHVISIFNIQITLLKMVYLSMFIYAYDGNM